MYTGTHVRIHVYWMHSSQADRRWLFGTQMRRFGLRVHAEERVRGKEKDVRGEGRAVVEPLASGPQRKPERAPRPRSWRKRTHEKTAVFHGSDSQ